MLFKRLAAPDCRAKGWLLDGFPHTAEQAATIQRAGIVPDKVRAGIGLVGQPRAAREGLLRAALFGHHYKFKFDRLCAGQPKASLDAAPLPPEVLQYALFAFLPP